MGKGVSVQRLRPNYKSIKLNIDFLSTYHQKNQFQESNSGMFSSFLL